MSRYSLKHVSDRALLRGLAALVARDRVTTADLLAHIAEVDARGLYRDQGSPSMFAYCVEKLRLSEDAAYKRIQAARAARRFPLIFHALAEGRLHLTGVRLLAAHLTEENAAGLLAAAQDKSKAEIEQMLAERFPRPGLLAWVASLPGAPGDGMAGRLAPGQVDVPVAARWAGELAPGQVGMTETGHAPGQAASGPVAEQVGQAGAVAPGGLAPGQVGTSAAQHAPGHVDGPPAPARVERSRVQPLAPQTYGVQFTLSQSEYELLCHAQALLGHQIPSGDIGQAFKRSLQMLVRELEKGKFAATAQPRRSAPRPTRSPRHIPAHVKRAVWERDGGRCTFVGETGARCSARTRLEFDHIEEVARRGEATVSGIRLLCRAQNQLMAERTFGAEFMRHRRLAASERRAATRARAFGEHAATEPGAHEAKATRADGGFAEAADEAERAAAQHVAAERAATVDAAAERAAAERAAAERARELDVAPWLRALGFSASAARSAAAVCEDMPDATLEQRVKAALSHFRPRGTTIIRPVRQSGPPTWPAPASVAPTEGGGDCLRRTCPPAPEPSPSARGPRRGEAAIVPASIPRVSS